METALREGRRVGGCRCDLPEPHQRQPNHQHGAGPAARPDSPGGDELFFAFDAREPRLRDTFEKVSAADSALLRWGEIGIHEMAELVARNRWGDRLAAPTDICPIPPFQMVDAIAGGVDVEEIIEQTSCRAIHLYNEIMRTASIDKNGVFPPNSVISVLEKRVSENEMKSRGAGS
jgi:hypothetical protein